MITEYSVEQINELAENLMSCCRCIGYAKSGNERANHIAAANAAKEKLISAFTHPPAPVHYPPHDSAECQICHPPAQATQVDVPAHREWRSALSIAAETLEVEAEHMAEGGHDGEASRMKRSASIIRSMLGAPTAEPVAQCDGWIVGNSEGTRWRSWNAEGSMWVESREDATRYARREDAELVHAEDENAWRITPYTTEPVAHAGADGGVGIDCVSHSPDAADSGWVVSEALRLRIAEVLFREGCCQTETQITRLADRIAALAAQPGSSND